LQRCHDRRQRPIGQHRFDLCGQPIAAGLSLTSPIRPCVLQFLRGK
jgi:hypothetical protein